MPWVWIRTTFAYRGPYIFYILTSFSSKYSFNVSILTFTTEVVLIVKTLMWHIRKGFHFYKTCEKFSYCKIYKQSLKNILYNHVCDFDTFLLLGQWQWAFYLNWSLTKHQNTKTLSCIYELLISVILLPLIALLAGFWGSLLLGQLQTT